MKSAMISVAPNHAMKFGASYNRYTKNQKLFLNAEGGYTFNGSQTNDDFKRLARWF